MPPGSLMVPGPHDPRGDADADADGTAESVAAALVHTTTTGAAYPPAALTDSLPAYAGGPADLADPFVREKITHFDHERIPERVVHARGSGAHGRFRLH
ncbi:hypothetical protein HK405_004913, partial [Cladochytrium tenue]